MTDLPDVEATVKLVKEILSESLNLVSEKRRFRAFLQDYARRAHTEQGLLLEGKHLKALVSGMGYPGFDEVVSGNKAAARSVGLRGLGDWLARTEGYDGVLCQWVEEVWSHALGLGGRKPVSDLSKAKEAAGQAGHHRVEQKKADGAGWAVAAEQGDADAQFRLGEMYKYGRGIRQDGAEAVKWYRQAAEQGHAAAQKKLGWMYANGRGVRQDDEEAVKWYRLVAEQGHAAAQNKLGWMYANGRGVRQDDEEAVKWYRLAAEQGHAAARYNLGGMYYNGCGVQKNYEKAVKWYRRAAEQGHADAQTNLGWMYENGRGVRQDDEMAVKWYRLAAEQGHAAARQHAKEQHLRREKERNAAQQRKAAYEAEQRRISAWREHALQRRKLYDYRKKYEVSFFLLSLPSCITYILGLAGVHYLIHILAAFIDYSPHPLLYFLFFMVLGFGTLANGIPILYNRFFYWIYGAGFFSNYGTGYYTSKQLAYASRKKKVPELQLAYESQKEKVIDRYDRLLKNSGQPPEDLNIPPIPKYSLWFILFAFMYSCLLIFFIGYCLYSMALQEVLVI